MTSEDYPSDPAPRPVSSKETLPPRLFRSEELFQGDRVVCIEHEGAIYRLQITSRGKLIMQK